MKISGNIVDILNKKIYPGTVEFRDSRITAIEPSPEAAKQYILPGFIDAHVHVESSMLIPSEFARLAVVHGTVSTVSDPHEIGNVLGVEGVQFMIDNGKQVPFKFNFGAPSCVPATPFETAGATIRPSDIEALMKNPDIRYLAEMMNWPGVLYGDPEVKEKIAIAHRYNKVVDGHAPGLKGDDAIKYASAGITTDHECFTEEEAIDKLKAGMKIIIREGSAARNFDALIGLLHHHENEIMFCSDDKHPDSLEVGHINQLVARAVDRGIDIFKILKAACVNPVVHYDLDVGLLRPNDPADFIVVEDFKTFTVKQTFINGTLVAENGRSRIISVKSPVPNNFNVNKKDVLDFQVPAKGKKVSVIVAEDGQLITKEEIHECRIEGGLAVADVQRDILKLAVVNRYRNEPPAVAFIKNFNLKRGAIASSVGHDSHNIIVVGTDDDSICRAVNLIITAKGGVSAIDGEKEQVLALPVGGIMSAEDGYEVARKYKMIDNMAKTMGSTLGAPYMTLSFMALLVIPSLKLSDKGLFNGKDFRFTSLFV